MTETEMIVWLAALLEGEGCFNCGKRNSGSLNVGIRLSMTDRDVIERAMTIMHPTGRIWHKIGTRYGRVCKPIYDGGVSGYRAIRIMKAILPYMLSRRTARILEIIKLWDNRHNPKREKGLPPTCHPNRPHRALGLCNNCYAKLPHRRKLANECSRRWKIKKKESAVYHNQPL